MATKTFSIGKLILTLLLGGLCLGAIIFGYWHVISGWNGHNAIFEYFRQFHDTSLGWVKFACVNGGLQWAVGGAAFYLMVAPLLLLISAFGSKTLSDWCSSFLSVLVGAIGVGLLASIPGILFNTMSYLMEVHPIGCFVVGALAVLSLIPTGGCVVGIVVSTGSGFVAVFRD